jgi:hypothetical protein
MFALAPWVNIGSGIFAEQCNFNSKFPIFSTCHRQ